MPRCSILLLLSAFLLSSVACSPNFAVNLDGEGDFVEVKSSTTLQPVSALTVEAWTLAEETTSVSLPQPIVSKGRAPSSVSYAFWFQNGEVAFQIEGTSGASKATTVSVVKVSEPSRGAWHHIAGTWDGDTQTQRLYIDGIPRAERQTPFEAVAYNSSAKFFIGGQDTDGDNMSDAEMSGEIDEVRVWNVARSTRDIQLSMNQKLRGNEEGLSAYWQFDDGNTDVATDSTGNGNIGLLMGDAHLTSSTVPVQNLSFAGTYSATFIIDGREDERHVYPMTITQTASRLSVTIDYSTPEEQIVEEGDGEAVGGTFEVVTKSSQILQFYTGTDLKTLTTSFDEEGNAESFQGEFKWFFQTGEETQVTDTGSFSAVRVR